MAYIEPKTPAKSTISEQSQMAQSFLVYRMICFASATRTSETVASNLQTAVAPEKVYLANALQSKYLWVNVCYHLYEQMRSSLSCKSFPLCVWRGLSIHNIWPIFNRRPLLLKYLVYFCSTHVYMHELKNMSKVWVAYMRLHLSLISIQCSRKPSQGKICFARWLGLSLVKPLVRSGVYLVNTLAH